METTTLKIANWNELKAKLKEKFPILTDTELVYSTGKESELVSKISKKLGKSEEEINDAIGQLQGGKKEAMGTSESSKAEPKEKKEAIPSGAKESEKKY